MRFLLPAAVLLPLTACGASWIVPVGAAAGVNLVSVVVLHRSLFDVIWSFASGRDCSIVRLDRGLSYCKPPEPEPPPLPYCTRTLGWVECWTDPQVFFDPPRQVADGPYKLTPAQEKNRTHGWP
ncbi:MAG: hypothetical protein M0002_20015 [Rhodospirillales bacterium]|nr:hypothetical protein [Rhodospirillales bacterium]